MKFASLGSGSKGNATLVKTKATTLLIDCGFSLKQTKLRLEKLNIALEDINAILVTHEHSDHINGVARVAKAANIPVWASSGTISSQKLDNIDCQTINIHHQFSINDCTILPVAVPHDAKEPCQFTIYNGTHRLGILTDVGHITSHIINSFYHCDALLLETNHDIGMLQNGSYPSSLKYRVGGNLGHLNNLQAAELLKNINHEKLQKLVLMHISEQNNSPTLANHAICEALDCAKDFPILARQDIGFDWIQLS